MDKLIRILILSFVILFSQSTATAQIAAQDAEQSRAREIQAAKATATKGIANYIREVSISVAEFQRPGPKREFDMWISVTAADDNDDAIDSVDVICPGGKEISITRERQDLDGAGNHTVATREGDDGPLSFGYSVIATESFKEYGTGTYTFVINHESGSERIMIPAVDPDTGAKLKPPPFPELTSKIEGTITSPISVEIKKMDFITQVFLGKVDGQSEGFLEEVNRYILAGEETTDPIELSRGDWGANLRVERANSGVVRGVSWSISFSADIDFDFSVK